MDLDNVIKHIDLAVENIELIEKNIIKFKNDLLALKEDFEYEKNINPDFPIGTKVKVICKCQDFHFFNGETGVIEGSQNDYLGLIVRFDKPLEFDTHTGKGVKETFNFGPDDLKKI